MSLTPYEIVMLVSSMVMFLFGIVGWLFNRLVNQHKELSRMKDQHQVQLDLQRAAIENSKFDRMLDRLDDLVTQIKVLFLKHDDHENKLATQSAAISRHDRIIAEQHTRCTEREKALERRLAFGMTRPGDVAPLASRRGGGGEP